MARCRHPHGGLVRPALYIRLAAPRSGRDGCDWRGCPALADKPLPYQRARCCGQEVAIGIRVSGHCSCGVGRLLDRIRGP